MIYPEFSFYLFLKINKIGDSVHLKQLVSLPALEPQKKKKKKHCVAIGTTLPNGISTHGAQGKDDKTLRPSMAMHSCYPAPGFLPASCKAGGATREDTEHGGLQTSQVGVF